MTHIGFRDAFSIIQILLYSPAIIIAVILCIRHGFRSSSGWRFLLTFILARLLSSSFQLATINDPHNTSLYTAEWVLLASALSPFELMALGLLSRALGSIERVRGVGFVKITTRHIQWMELLNTVAFVLGIVGGVKAGKSYDSTKDAVPASQTESKVAIILLIVILGLLVVATALTAQQIGFAEPGEKRIVVAVAVSLPFMFVRMMYSAVGMFNTSETARFSPVWGSVALLFGMGVLMELAVVFIYLAVGWTLKRIQHAPVESSCEEAELNKRESA
ncbi:uncharacterized protein J3D65DRAFT_615382 [Phyllosticta citribraziliensis]|uniref:DUF7702 domain-containing protein n=1 Tax=Phyllosticta citribraziliensis TaxID=989973 RepID=A0ABR1LZ32_9PEZI